MSISTIQRAVSAKRNDSNPTVPPPMRRRQSHRRRNLSALVLLASAAVLMLSSAPDTSNHLRVSRSLSIGNPGAEDTGSVDSNIDGDELIIVQQPKEVNKADEIPRLLHIVAVWIGDEPYPLYWNAVEEISRGLAKSQGFDAKVWDLPSLEEIINDPNHALEWVKPAWERVRETGQGARIADFARMLVVYVFGGVFLDLDMIPCSGLEHLVNANGVASFPFTQGGSGQVSNAAFSAPPRHPALNKIIHFIADNPNSHIHHVLDTTGPIAVATALQQYNNEYELGLPNVRNGEEIEEPLSWAASGDIRLGKFTYGGIRQKEPFHFYHASFGSWIDTRADSFESSCESEEKLHLIEPFIKEQCEGDNRLEFRRCGMEEATS